MADTDRDLSLNDMIDRLEKERNDLIVAATTVTDRISYHDDGTGVIEQHNMLHVAELENVVARIKRRMR